MSRRFLLSRYICLPVLQILLISTLFSQDRFPGRDTDPAVSKSQFNHISKRARHYTAKDWAAAIDSTWGSGLPTADKLAIFDKFWNTIDEKYAGFQNLDVNWDSLKSVFRPEIEAGVSRGRFAGIMSHLMLALREAHTVVLDEGVYGDILEPGVPLLVNQSAYYYADNGHFGAGLTPLPDSSLLVYKVVDSHPLGLELGDVVIGYDGIPWKDLYRELLDAQLPITSFSEPLPLYAMGGSSDRSASHLWLMSAGLNWHLFDIIDIVKYQTGDTLHLATNALVGQDIPLICTEQMPVPGVSMPDVGNMGVPWVTWGIVEGTQIGYIYVSAWAPELGTGPEFSNAVNTLLYDYQTTGLIIDSRINAGGGMDAANGGFSRLFNFDLQALGFAKRSDPDDHFAMTRVTSGMCSGQHWRYQADPYLYDRPIAVLTGPTAWSGGDYNAMRLRFHPMVRFFGKPTNTAYTCLWWNNIAIPYHGWYGQYASHNVFLAADPDSFLMHVGFEVDEEVWLTPDDVAQGHDTVVERAIAWIQNLAYAHDVSVGPIYAIPGIDTVRIAAEVENPNDDVLSVSADIASEDTLVMETISLYDDGNHGDGESGDGIWGTAWSVPTGEISYSVSVTTVDSTAETSRTLPNVVRFTTVGPVVFDGLTFVGTDTIPNSGDNIRFRIALKNNGSSATATNVTAQLSSDHSCVASLKVLGSPSYGDIAPGESGSLTQSYSKYRLSIDQDCPGDTDIPIDISISSEGCLFWRDGFTIHVEPSVGIAEGQAVLPEVYALHQNHPNPFNPVTTLRYDLPEISHVTLTIYDILGRQVRTLANDVQEPGYKSVTWDGTDEFGRPMGTGIYLYQISAGDFTHTRKMLLLK